MDRSIARSAPLLLLALSLPLLPVAGQDSGSDENEPHEQVLPDPQPVDPGFPVALENYQDTSCEVCHEVIAEEWSRTLHALAWVDPRYQDALKGRRRKESCVGCHAPEPMFRAEEFGDKPAPRKGDVQPRHFGISCRSCHLAPDKGVLGPYGIETDAHPSTKDERFTDLGSNELCIACHQTNIGPVIGLGRDFIAGGLPEKGASCVGCHMSPVERSMATDDDDNPTPVRKGRSHLLQTPRDPAFLARTFGLEAHVEEGETVLVIANQAGHRVPGLRERRIVFQVEALDDAGEAVAEGELTIDSRAYLALGASTEVRLPAPADRVRVVGIHLPPGIEKIRDGVRFCELELPTQ